MNTYFINHDPVFNATNIYHPGIGFVPFDEANMDYQDYLAWLAEGNIPEPWNPEEQ